MFTLVQQMTDWEMGEDSVCGGCQLSCEHITDPVLRAQVMELTCGPRYPPKED